MLSRVCVQDTRDVARWVALGLPPEKVVHTGSIKFDMKSAAMPVERMAAFRKILGQIGWGENDPVLLAASTHNLEEAALAKVFLQIEPQIPNLRLIVVPRHAERGEIVEGELKALNVRVARRSRLGSDDNSGEVQETPDCLLVDSTGELLAWQYLATVVVIGKSFLAKGGQNPAEAVMAGKPVVFGPHMENFDALVALLLHRKGATQVSGLEELPAALVELFHDPKAAKKSAEAGRKALTAHTGATGRTIEELIGLKNEKLL